MKKISNRRSLLLACLFVMVLAPIANAQTDAQVLSDFAAEVNLGLPKDLGDSRITSTQTFCQSGCQTYFSSPVLRLIGNTPRLAKASISTVSLGISIKAALLPDYCKHPARQRNVSIQVYLSDMFGADLGAVAFLQPSECPAAAATTPAGASSGNAQFLANYAAQTRRDIPVTNQGITFWKASTYCPAGCENVSTSDFLVIYAKHLSLRKNSIPLAQISTFFSPTLTKNYCDNSGGAAQRNVTLLVQLTDSNNDYVGEIARLTQASCRAKPTVAATAAPTPAATPKQVHTAESKFLTDWADEIRRDLPFAFGNLEFYESATYCAAGCQHNTTGAGFITVVGRTPQLSQTAAGATPYVPSVTTLFLDKYCDKARNTKYLMMVELLDKGGNYIGRPGSYSPADCPAAATVTTGQATISGSATSASVEQQLWDAVKNSTKAQDFQIYLNDYPAGQYASIAKLKIGQLGGTATQASVPVPAPVGATPATSSAGRSVEEQYWDAVKNSNRVQDYQSYLNDYPNGQFVPIARLRISQIGGTVAAGPAPAKTEDQVWADISSSQKSQDFRDYLNAYPNGKYVSIARIRIRQFATPAIVSAPVSTAVEEQYWDNVKNSTRAQDYQSYLNTFPLGRYASLARLKIDQLGTSAGMQAAPAATPGLTPQMTGTQILSMAQFGNIREMANLGTFWVLTDPNDLRSRQSISDELIKEYPRLNTATSFEDADFYLVFGMTDSSGAIVTDNTNRQNQVFYGEMLVFTSAGSSNGVPAIRILFRSRKSQSFTQAGLSLFQTGPAKATTRDFIKELKKISF